MDYLKPTEAAKLLNVSYFTLKQWIYGGKIQSIKTPGGHHRIPRAEIDKLVGGQDGRDEQEHRHILIAEDTQDTREFLAAYLTSWGYEITAAGTGRDAWEQVQKGTPFDLYLLDYGLPDIAGTDLCRMIREKDPLTPVIFFSAVMNEDVKKMALEAGAQDYLSKTAPEYLLKGRLPFDLLRERIDWWIQNPESDQEDAAGVLDSNN
jgi:excisionase family DNA binding protein